MWKRPTAEELQGLDHRDDVARGRKHDDEIRSWVMSVVRFNDAMGCGEAVSPGVSDSGAPEEEQLWHCRHPSLRLHRHRWNRATFRHDDGGISAAGAPPRGPRAWYSCAGPAPRRRQQRGGR